MPQPTTIAVAMLVALLVDALLGEPRLIYDRLPHPVVVLGRLVAAGEHYLLDEASPPERQQAAGLLMLVLLVVGAGSVGLVVQRLLLALPLGPLWLGLVASTLLAQRSLFEHVTAVATGLRQSLGAGRTAVAKIVGRDPQKLDAAAIGSAAIESLAENFSDGVIAPLFWGLIAGLPGMLIYKAINTADSMVGHRSPRHLRFGWASARTDDLVNLPASRLSAALLVGVAPFCRGNAKAAIEALRRDAPLHRSPNAGWPEAAVAGALALRLGGPRSYGGVPVEGHWMGDGRAEITPADIARALRLVRGAWWLALLATLVIVAQG